VCVFVVVVVVVFVDNCGQERKGKCHVFCSIFNFLSTERRRVCHSLPSLYLPPSPPYAITGYCRWWVCCIMEGSPSSSYHGPVVIVVIVINIDISCGTTGTGLKIFGMCCVVPFRHSPHTHTHIVRRVGKVWTYVYTYILLPDERVFCVGERSKSLSSLFFLSNFCGEV
jgi:hypothetical protein